MDLRTSREQIFSWSSVLMLMAIGFFWQALFLPAQESERVSRFGEYKGYTEERYNSWVRSSQYVTVRDGTQLAVDIIRPAINGEEETKPLPAIWSHTRYRRAFIQDGKIISSAEAPHLKPLLKHGYILAAVDVRGSGASFGTWRGIFTPEETQDAHEITEWLASQPWCNGKVGMVGGSYLGITQLMTASTKPPHLKAIFPAVALFDLYNIGSSGGIFYADLVRTWSALTRRMDTEIIAVHVDEDKDGALLKAAIEEHKVNRLLIDILNPLWYRDSKDELTGASPFLEWHPAAFIQEINESGVPVYLWCGWLDSFIRDGFLMYRNFNLPRKMVIGAWSHSPRDPKIALEEFGLMALEQLRWFDYWLKGIDNGIVNEPPIHYQTMKGPKDSEWKSALRWPLAEAKPKKFYFHAGPSGSIKSVNDGFLDAGLPSNSSGKDDYLVDYSTTTGQATRWDNAVGGGFSYSDLTPNDQKALTYTSSPLEADFEVTGHPVVHLWVSSTASDGDFFACLEEVDAKGVSHYITEGSLRASYRALQEPPYDNLGLSYHRSFREDVKDLVPGEPAELDFDLLPTSNVFNAGHRIRLVLACADRDNAATPELSPPPTVTIYRDTQLASFILLPEVETAGEEEFPLLVVLLVALVIIILTIVFAFYARKKQ